jgi:hypothetical protein
MGQEGQQVGGDVRGHLSVARLDFLDRCAERSSSTEHGQEHGEGGDREDEQPDGGPEQQA